MKPCAPTLLLTALSLALPLQAATDWRNNRLQPLEKVTVGPSDNYQAQPDETSNRLYFTRNQHLIASLLVQDLDDGRHWSLLPEGIDAKDPVLSPDRQQLAFTSFRQDALGDVCVQALPDGALRCLTPHGSREWMPFWVGNDQIGYLRSRVGDNTTELVLQSLQGGNPQVLLQGALASPASSADGRYLVYQRLQETGNALHLYDLQQKRELGRIPLDLPGISSYAAIDSERGWLYFAHYLNDTSADQQIDAEDHSVIFRLPLQQALQAEKPLLPEQLTSVARNCNFPALGREHLYVTCAFEGSLDTYRLPLSGQVPDFWNQEQLLQAHATTGSHEERLLLLNVLRNRFNIATAEVLERQLSNHLELGEHTAARHYARQLQQHYRQQDQAALADFYANLDRLLLMQAAQARQPLAQGQQRVLTLSFQQQLQAQRQQLLPSPSQGSSPLFQTWFDLLEQQPVRAQRRLQQARLPDGNPLQAYLLVELQRQLLQDQPAALSSLLEQAARNPQLPDNARLFYAVHYLRLQGQLHPDTQARRQAVAAALPRFTESRLTDLLQNELDLLALGQSTDTATDRSLWQGISQRLRQHQDDPALRRALHIRAIQLMGLAQRYDMMELMSRNWLTLTRITEVAFAETAENYARINRDRAYGSLQQGQPATALNTFYAVIRQTADLESLYNLLNIGLDDQNGLQERLTLLYNQLQNEQLLRNNTRYADALRLLLQNPQPSDAQLQQATGLLQGFQPDGLDGGAFDLLLGSLHHRRLLLGQTGYQYSQNLFQQANHHYLLGLDLSWSNPRLQATLLDNLGRLHLAVRNYGQAAGFFALRLELPFVAAEEAVWLRWRLARALFHSNRAEEAAQQAQLALQQAENLQLPDLLPLRERTAFYSLQAGHYATAEATYAGLLDESLDAINRAKALLNRGYALFHLQQQQAARNAFLQLLQELPGLPVQPATDYRLAPFQPRRLELQAYGFLAQLSQPAQERQRWLEQRLALLEQMQDSNRTYGFDEQGRLTQVIQTRLQLIATLEQQQDIPAMAEVLQASQKDLDAWQQAGGALASQPVLQALYNQLVLAADYPEALASSHAPLQGWVKQVLEALTVEPFTPPVNQAQQLKLTLLQHWWHYRQGQQTAAQLVTSLQQLQQDERWQALPGTRPDLHQELESLARGLLQLSLIHI